MTSEMISKRLVTSLHLARGSLISRQHNQNLVILSERDYNELDKAHRNVEYLSMIKESRQQFAEGKTYTFTVDELYEMENMTAPEMRTFAEAHKNF